MRDEITITREIAPLPVRSPEAHKGEVGRVMVIGGCHSDDVSLIGAPALAANAALRSGAGLVQVVVPAELRPTIAGLAPCATLRALPGTAEQIIAATQEFGADVLAIGPGLGDSLSAAVVTELLQRFAGPVVLDADGLNLLAAAPPEMIPDAHRVVLTPHAGEAVRLLRAKCLAVELDRTATSRRSAAAALNQAYGCVIVLKGHGTVVTNGDRMFINETGNAGMATGGTGDVLTGVIAALLGQRMPALEAAILGVYLHGLAGDYAAEELGLWSVTASDLLDFLPEAFSEHDMTRSD